MAKQMSCQSWTVLSTSAVATSHRMIERSVEFDTNMLSLTDLMSRMTSVCFRYFRVGSVDLPGSILQIIPSSQPQTKKSSCFCTHDRLEVPRGNVLELRDDFEELFQLQTSNRGSLKLMASCFWSNSTRPMIGFWNPSRMLTILPLFGFQMIAVWSIDPLARYPDSSSMMQRTVWVWPSRTLTHLPDFGSQMRMLASEDPDTIIPFLRLSTQSTSLLCLKFFSTPMISWILSSLILGGWPPGVSLSLSVLANEFTISVSLASISSSGNTSSGDESDCSAALNKLLKAASMSG